jgi:Copine
MFLIVFFGHIHGPQETFLFVCQFVPFKDFADYTDAGRAEAFAKAVLEEVPQQLVSYMRKNGVEPKAAIKL